MSKKTFNALIARGFDSETANHLTSAGHTLNTLKNLDEHGLRVLNISEELIRVILREPRPPIPVETLNKVLYNSRMTCCVCRDISQGIIIHHIHELSDSRSHAEDNLVVFDTEKNQVLDFIKISPNSKNKNDYVDSLSLAFYQDYLLSINRSNYELVVIDRNTLQHLVSVPLGGTGNGPRHICLHHDQAYISHSEYAGIISVDLHKLLELLPQPHSKMD